MLAQKDQASSQAEADEVYRHFLQHEPMPGTEGEVALAKQFVTPLTVEEVSAWAKGFLPERSRLLVVTLPQKDGLAPPTEAGLQAIEAKVAALVIPAPAEVALPPLLAAAPTPGTVAATDEAALAPLGFTTLTLSNGVKVYAVNAPTSRTTRSCSLRGLRRELRLADADVVLRAARHVHVVGESNT